MIRKVYKHYYRCSTDSTIVTDAFGDELIMRTNGITFNGLRNVDGSYSSVPSWFTQSVGFPLYSTYWTMFPPAEDNTTYNFSWTFQFDDVADVEYIVTLSMIDYCNLDLGCDTATRSQPVSMLTWLTREGGWTMFPFKGKKSFEVTIPDAQTYVNGQFVLRATSRKGVYEGETLTTGNIPELALDLLQSLKESIQVYYVENFDTAGEEIYQPVMLQSGDFFKRKTDERRWDVTVKFIYAEERQIQTQ